MRDDTLAGLAREAVIEYWTLDGKNEIGVAGVKMIEPAFMCAWNWDARPFPVFPQSDVWSDAGNWRAGTWIGGKEQAEPPLSADLTDPIITGPVLPPFAGQDWAVAYRPVENTDVVPHVSGRESRAGRNAATLWEMRMDFEVLTDIVQQDVQMLAGAFVAAQGSRSAVFVEMPPELGLVGGADLGGARMAVRQALENGLASQAAGMAQDYGLASEPSWLAPFRFADDDLDVEAFMAHLFAVKSLTLRMVR